MDIPADPLCSGDVAPARHGNMGYRAFVAMIAALMIMNGVAIDSMLPVLPAIGRTLHIANEGDRQWIITAYLLGLGAAQLFHGTLSDRFGRRRILLIGIATYVVCSMACALATSLSVMVIARALQGAGASAARVVSVSVVRDCYAGRQMARVMSLAFMVFLLVPVLAPAIGQGISLIGPWQLIFWAFAVFAAFLFVWVLARLPETLDPGNVVMLNPAAIFHAWRKILSDRVSVGYTIGLTVLQGGLLGFINSIQQVMADFFKRPSGLPIVFAMIGLSMAAGSLLGSRLVERVGTRRLSHSSLVLYLVIQSAHLFVAVNGRETLGVFIGFQSSAMFCFSMCGPTFGAIAMENLGDVAGSAASLQGFVGVVGGALAGIAIGKSFDGTAVPMIAGIVICGAAGLIAILITERGRMFRPTHGPVTLDFGH